MKSFPDSDMEIGRERFERTRKSRNMKAADWKTVVLELLEIIRPLCLENIQAGNRIWITPDWLKSSRETLAKAEKMIVHPGGSRSTNLRPR